MPADKRQTNGRSFAKHKSGSRKQQMLKTFFPLSDRPAEQSPANGRSFAKHKSSSL
jgi:hypothetical protein